MLKVYVNGEILPLKEAKISLSDRGLHYGDGVFDSLRTYHGKPFLLEEHLKRLYRDARLLHLPIAKTLKAAAVPGIIKSLIELNHLKEAYIKIIITRGEAKEHGLDPTLAKGKPTVIILTEAIKEYPPQVYIQGWKAIISRIVRPEVPTSSIKSLNYLDNILAKIFQYGQEPTY